MSDSTNIGTGDFILSWERVASDDGLDNMAALNVKSAIIVDRQGNPMDLHAVLVDEEFIDDKQFRLDIAEAVMGAIRRKLLKENPEIRFHFAKVSGNQSES